MASPIRSLLICAIGTCVSLAGQPPMVLAAAKAKAVNAVKAGAAAVPSTGEVRRVKRVDSGGAAAALKSAKTIDQLVNENLKRHKLESLPRTTDEQFIRRIYLDIAGAIPLYQQVNVFLASRAEDKRARLIDNLLNSDGYVSHQFNYWADVLRLTGKVDRNISAGPYIDWVKNAIADNMPYDRFVFELLTADGKYWQNPATGYALRDAGMPLDAMSNTLRIFLSTQIGCAQCHNHPFDQWTQKEFYEMAAFTFGMQPRVGGKDKMFGGRNPIDEISNDLKKLDPKFKKNGPLGRLMTTNLYVVRDDPKRKLKLPFDYRYDDAKPQSVVEPATIFPPDVELSNGQAPRKAFGRWLTSPENPRFATSIANRLWQLALGRGLIEPVDDIRENSEPENPELLKFLTAEMLRLKFDLKEFQRILYNTQAYQRQAIGDDPDAGEPYHFPGPLLRRMTAEQVWDSFIALAVFTPENYHAPSARAERELSDLDLKKATAKDVTDRQEALKALNSSKVRAAREKDHVYKGLLLVRASELPLPIPVGHFLREFGQSDHELIQTSSTEGSVPQVLQMLNGPVTHMLLEEGSLLHHNVMSRHALEDRMNVIFLSILSRKPSREELAVALEEVRAHSLAGYGNVIWSLVNTREFLFIH